MPGSLVQGKMCIMLTNLQLM